MIDHSVIAVYLAEIFLCRIFEWAFTSFFAFANVERRICFQIVHGTNLFAAIKDVAGSTEELRREFCLTKHAL